MKILGNRCLLEQLPPQSSEGAIHFAHRYLPEQQIHRVVALGSGVKDPGLSIGDLVLLDQYSIGNRTGVGHNLWIIDVKDIALAVGTALYP